ncbi:MAG: cysteine hydrolase [Candidatus Heimdallarchaeota archaeon]|nr:cysteine hydrolase [Candidatus Heimdallarchaeota archaeon]MCK4253341.1 cysteine hydrolase [Candidatus Heimdallarchaeota archaeon]
MIKMHNVNIVFWDVDTQKDLMDPDGKLYVNDAEKLKGNLEKLTQYARLNGIRILGSVDYHSDMDPEIDKENPDFNETFPPHCLKNDPGQEKIMETRSEMTLWVDPITYPQEKIIELIEGKGPIIFRKTQLSAFSNPNLIPIINQLKPQKIIVYGVSIDFSVKTAIEGFLEQSNDFEIYLVIDAIEGRDEEKSRDLISHWIEKGVKSITTEGVLQGVLNN